MFRVHLLSTTTTASIQALHILPQNCFSSWWQILAELALLAGPPFAALPPQFLSPGSQGRCRAGGAGSARPAPLPAPRRSQPRSCPHQPPLRHKLACSQTMNMLINPLFQQQELRAGFAAFAGVANTENGVGGFPVVCISFISACCYTLSPFLLPFLCPCLYLCPFVFLSHFLPQVGVWSKLFFPISCSTTREKSHLWFVDLSTWNTGFG